MSATPPCEREDACITDIEIWKGLELDEDRPGELDDYADADERFIPEWERRFEEESNGETRVLRSGQSRPLKTDLITFGISTVVMASIVWFFFEVVIGRGATVTMEGHAVPLYQPTLHWTIFGSIFLFLFIIQVVLPHAPGRIGGGRWST